MTSSVLKTDFFFQKFLQITIFDRFWWFWMEMKANDQSFTENMFTYFCGAYDVINLREWVLLTYLVFLYLPSNFDVISTHSWAQSKGSIFLVLTLRDLWRHRWWRHHSPRVSTTHILSFPLFTVRFSWDFYTQLGTVRRFQLWWHY